MAVYVGLNLVWPASRKWPYKTAAHLVADTTEELQSFAVNKLYLKPEWFQAKSSPHFDLTSSKRLLAIKQGAIPFDSVYEEGKFLIERKKSKLAAGPTASAEGEIRLAMQRRCF